MEKGGAWLTLASIHHYGMTSPEVNALARRIRGMACQAPSGPTAKMAVLVGDFNYDAPEEGAHRPGPAALRSVAPSMAELR